MSDVPGRETRAAETGRRWSWGGHGEGGVAEKSGFGLFVDDVVFVFAELSVLALPALYHVLTTADVSYVGVKGSTMIAWMTMVLGGAFIRGGWVTPVASDVRGWVSLTPRLVVLRLAYYNLALFLAGYGGSWVGTVSPIGSAVGAFLVGAVAIGVFPKLAEVVAGIGD